MSRKYILLLVSTSLTHSKILQDIRFRQASTSNALRGTMRFQSFLFLLFAVSSLAIDQYHQHRSMEVEETIRRYSRDTNVEIGPIKMKQFKRTYAAEHSLVTDSESKKFKYVCQKSF